MRFQRGLSLRRKIALLTVLGLLIGAGVFSFLAVRAANEAIETMLQERVTTAQLAADFLDRTLEMALAELDRTAQSMAGADEGATPGPRIAALETTYSALSLSIRNIYLVGESGHVIWNRPVAAGGEAGSISPYATVAQVVAGGGTGISGLVAEPSTNLPVVLLASPVPGEAQASSAVLVVAVDPARSSIGGLVQPLRLGRTGYVEIIDQNGVVVARTGPGPEPAPFETSDHSGRFAALIAAGAPTRGLCHSCHERVEQWERRDVLAFVPLSQARWGVVIRQSEEEALAPVNELRLNLLLSGLGLVMAGLVSMVVTTRGAFVQLRRLTSASKRIADGDLSSPVAPSQPDEIGELAQAMDDMRVKLGASYWELEQRTSELSSLLSVSQSLTSLLDLSTLDGALGDALERTLEAVKASCGGIMLVDEEGRTLCYRVSRGLSEEAAAGVCVPLGEGIAGRVAQTGEPVFVGDVRDAGEILAGYQGVRALACVPLRSKEQVVGVISVASSEPNRFSPRDIEFLEGVAGQITIALENANLHQQVRQHDRVRGELLLDILTIQEDERKRIARELHDETSQSLASLVANLEAVAGMLPAAEARVSDRLRKAQAISIGILDDIHKLIYELRPALLDDMGLVAAIRWMADNNLGAAGVNVQLEIVGREKRLPPAVEIAVFRVVQEAVSNIARHASARNASLRLHFQKNAVKVRVQDDGKGFDVQEALSSRNRPRGLGLLGMRERIGLVNGALTIRSHVGAGARISIQIPLEGDS